MKKKARRVLPVAVWVVIWALLFLAASLFVAADYKTKHFGSTRFDEILFYLNNGAEGGNLVNFKSAVLGSLPWVMILVVLFGLPVVDWFHNKLAFDVKIGRGLRRKIFRFNPSRVRFRYKLGYSLLVFVVAAVSMLNSFGFWQFLELQSSSSKIYENEYRDPSKVTLKFPDKKRNLVYIFLESMEGTLGSKQNGGAGGTSYIPELEKLALQNTSFSNNSLPLGGAYALAGATWTVGAMAAQSGGVPLENSVGLGQNDMGTLKQFLPGMYNLGDVLKQNGYAQEIMMGSDATFGARDKLYTQHGDYMIFDYVSAKKTGKIPSNYKTWWGLEDKKLFKFAKEEVTKLASGDQPFNLQLLTADTHFSDGYLDPSCASTYGQKYLDVYACSSKQVSEFIAWLQKQPFAENTTIVVSGDHPGMQTDFYAQFTTENPQYQRTVYNLFVNPAVQATNAEQFNRQFSTMDMFPTTLAALGVTIDGERLGLGVNLFSGQKTLVETYGRDELNTELARHSAYYDAYVLTK